MAKYTLGTGISQFKGSRGGSVFQRSGSTFSIRTRRKPRFQRTPRTSQSRSNFHSVQSVFPSLSPAQKTSWANQTSNFTRVNSLGNVYELSPVNLHGSQNKVLADSEFSLVQTASAPVVFPNPSLSNLLFTASPGNAVVTTNPLVVPSDFEYQYFVSRPVPADSVDLGSLDYVLIESAVGGLNSNFNWFSLWQNRFGINPSDIGLFVAFRMDIVSTLTGQKTSQFNVFSQIS